VAPPPRLSRYAARVALQRLDIADGSGVTPFLSWIRSADGEFDRQVDFF
jgi:predicted ferric reductase